jgi:hypothetical protein
MSKVALFIRHKTRPGKRDAVREVWMRHMEPSIARNPAQRLRGSLQVVKLRIVRPSADDSARRVKGRR